MRDIALAYLSLYRKANNIYLVNVVTAAELPDEEVDRLRRLVEKHLGGAGKSRRDTFHKPVHPFSVALFKGKLIQSLGIPIRDKTLIHHALIFVFDFVQQSMPTV